MHKTRPAHDMVEVTEITGRVRGKIAILGDDVIMTGGTLLANVERAARSTASSEVWVFATHGLFCGDALERFARRRHQGHRRHRHGADRPARSARTNMTVLPVSRPARRDDHERLRRRLGLGDLRRREPALLDGGFNRPHGARSERCSARALSVSIYIVIGVAIAAQKHYFEHLDTIRTDRISARARDRALAAPCSGSRIDLHIKK